MIELNKKLTKTTQKYIEENNLSAEQFFKEYHPNIIAIIEQEKVWTLDRLRKVLPAYIDYNMLFLYEDNPFYPMEGYPINEDNLEQYNLINVVAFNVSMNKMRQHWKGMPEAANGHLRKNWPECSDLRDMIICGYDQGVICRKFSEVFGEYAVLPRDVEGKKLLLEKYNIQIQSHRKFYYVDKNGNKINKNKLSDLEADFLNENGGYNIDFLVAPEDVPQTSKDYDTL